MEARASSRTRCLFAVKKLWRLVSRLLRISEGFNSNGDTVTIDNFYIKPQAYRRTMQEYVADTAEENDKEHRI